MNNRGTSGEVDSFGEKVPSVEAKSPSVNT